MPAIMITWALRSLEVAWQINLLVQGATPQRAAQVLNVSTLAGSHGKKSRVYDTFPRHGSEWVQHQLQVRASPWDNNRESSSPLLAFGALLQQSLIEMKLPQWIHNGRCV